MNAPVTHSILVIEDDAVLNRLLLKTLACSGFDMHSAQTWAEARARIDEVAPDLVLLDMNLPDARDFGPLTDIAQTRPVIMLTAYGSINQAVEAMRLGAVDYLVKPVNLEELELVIQRALEGSRLRAGDALKIAHRGLVDDPMVGGSEPMRQVRSLIEAVADDDVTVLVRGESGAGKELVARAVHDAGQRRDGHFVAVDCCTLQETLFETELFGHERGAFTGADRRKPGLIEAAAEGTLFLDEIGEIGPSIQAKLLRVLETGRFRRVGATTDLRANVRVVVATNRDLAQMVREGRFRADLYYRLSAFEITVPPLRDRRDDIPRLVDHFARARARNGRQVAFSDEALARLLSYDWPGNVRELRNVVERALILASRTGLVGPEHLPPLRDPGFDTAPTAAGPVTIHGEPTLDEIERHYLAELLDRHQGNRRRVAEALGVSERTAYRMLERYGFKGRGDAGEG